uniref:Uncharacterized protein n=1 Tax=Leptospirillum sp. Group II '5-way CG' TaxID=419541 RepID=B6AM26_9BACT|nr:MAG: Hypothetical protein CGL2_11277172 [Leptospirillum sp. Group II '5-way CG']
MFLHPLPLPKCDDVVGHRGQDDCLRPGFVRKFGQLRIGWYRVG